MLSTLASLGVADQLRDGAAHDVAELARRLGCREPDLESLLRAAAGLGVLREAEPGHFALTERGEQLCMDRLGAFAAFLGSRSQWDPWARLREALVEHGTQTPFAKSFGRGLYEHLRADPTAAAEYDAAIDAFTRHEAALLRGRLQLGDRRLLVDVGGGRGTLLRELLDEAADDARGVLFDLEHVVAAVRDELPKTIEARAGDFFESVPAGGDVYLIKHVLHNWDDERAVRILQNCRDAMCEDGVVVVLDAVLAPDNRPDLARMLDLEMRVLCGGRERRKPELRRLLARAGLRLHAAGELHEGTWWFVCGRR